MKEHQNLKGSVQAFAIENYELIEQIGEGGYGLVFKAKQISTGQHVAIKTLKFQGLLDAQKRKQHLARFERETNLCAKINHHNIVRLIDKGFTTREEPFAVFEFVAGITLKQYITQHQGLSANETKNLMSQVLDALICAHESGVIHRDLKPQNIMVTNIGARPHVKILDFGIGTFTQDFRSDEYQTLTLTQEFLGTPNYSAPEQLRGEPPTEKSDLYAWGLILIECLTGKSVIKGKSIAEVFQQQLMPANVAIPPAILGHPLGDLIRRVLEKNPQRRIASAQVILEELELINFSTLIGSIQAAGRVGIIDEEEDEEDMTMVNTLLSRSSSALRKQITVLAIKLNLVLAQKSSLDLETLDAVEKDQLNLCKDISSKYGGYLAGGLSNHILVYFGYPEVHDTDARRAGRTALELITDARKRSALLEEAHGIRIELRTAIHSGTVLVLPNQIPEGNVPNTAFELLYQAESGSVLASSTAKKLLEPFLDFELAKSVKLPNEVELVPTYALLGERQSEALSALKSWSIQRDMIGREKETSLLSEYWRKAQQGIQAVVLNGQAGIGKSRLTHEVKKYVQANGHVFRESRCLPEQQNSALSPFLNMLRRHWGLTGSESAEEEVQRLAEVLTTIKVNQDEAFPVLCSWFSLPLPAGIKMSVKSPDEQKGILFEILKECVITIDVDKPFLLIVEDLHWIDPTSQEFIEFLLKAGAQAAMMLLMTTRPTEVAILPEVPVISLEPLTDSAIETMIKSVLRNAAIAPKAVHYIVERTDGIPLFVEELTNMLLEQRYLTLVDQQYELVADIEDKAIPITLQALLNAKLDRLGFAKETAQLAATIGREFGYDLLVKASVKDEAMVQSDLNQLIEADLVFHQRRINEDRYLFRHALIGDAAYSGMTQSRQKEVHQTLAESLETYFPTTVSNEPFTVARHWAGAQSFGRATDYGIKTIQKLVASSANQEALGVNEEVIHWISQMGDGFEKYKNELVLNENMLPVFTLIQGWGSEKIETVVKRNNELIASLQSYSSNQHSTETASFLAKSEWMLLSNYLSKAEDEKVLELGERILKRLETNDDHQLKMAVSLALGQTYLNISKFAQAKILLELVIRESKAKNDLLIYTVYGFDPCVHAYGVMTVVHYMSGDINKAVLYAQESIDYALKVNSTLPIGTAYVFASLLYAVLNKPDKVKSLIDEVYETHTDKLRNSTSEKVLFILQDWANEETERSSEILEAIINAHQTNSSYWYEYLLVTTFIKQGKYKTAQKWLLRCIDRADDYAKPFLFRLLASSIVHEKQELSVEAISYFKMSIQLAQAHHTYWLELHTTYEYFILMDEQNKNWMVLLERMKTLLNKTSGGEAFELYQHVQKVLIKHGKDD